MTAQLCASGCDFEHSGLRSPAPTSVVNGKGEELTAMNLISLGQRVFYEVPGATPTDLAEFLHQRNAVVSDSRGKLAIWRDNMAEPVAMVIRESGTSVKTYIRFDLPFHEA
jgi:hypothetical protein